MDRFDVFDDKLPKKLIEQLKLTSGEDDRILKIFVAGGEVLNISEVLVGYYKLFGQIKKRPWMMSNLYRMSKKKLLTPTPNRGEYKVETKK